MKIAFIYRIAGKVTGDITKYKRHKCNSTRQYASWHVIVALRSWRSESYFCIMATANGLLCNISGSVSENGSLVGCMESDVEQETVASIQTWIAYLLIPVNLLNILANLLVILAVTRTSHLQEPAHKLIANLAVADFIMGVRGVFIVPITFLIEFPPKIICLGHFSVVLISSLASTNSLIAINVDRYIAISRPLHYYQIVTPRVILLMVVLVWVIAVFVSVLSLIGNRWQPDQPCIYDIVSSKRAVISGSVFTVICVVAIASIYAYIIMIAKHHQQQIHPKPSNSGLQEAGAPKNPSLLSSPSIRSWPRRLASSSAPSSSCWTPYLFLILLSVADVYHDTLGVATGFGYLMADSNSFINFYIYASKIRQFRAAFRAVLPTRWTLKNV
ncbi:PREDICTED: adenosine receptor A3-like [Priapulus caudatus]|uniref:Adenosine receptor A3-like n=1 Tax=Priapulus caudatus TaxID=37621 RepID=A0ABM1F553_PRICU|nr:PREDICTED: adenosine receptor A3-like [Priapulus caudatus]